MNQRWWIVIVISATLWGASSAFATSGWGQFHVQVEGQYEIYGQKTGQGFMTVYKLNGSGTEIQPPLITSSLYPNLGPLSQYLMTKTHLVTRHGTLVPHPAGGMVVDESIELFFVVRRSDDRVTGPLTADEFADHSASQGSKLNWKTPRAPGDSPLDELFIAAVMMWPVTLVAIGVLNAGLILTAVLLSRLARKSPAQASTSRTTFPKTSVRR